MSRPRLEFWLVAALFGLPFVAAWWLAFFPGLIKEEGNHYGELIEPIMPTGIDGAWRAVVPAPAGCDPSCKQTVKKVSLVKRALGAEGRRIAPPIVCAPGEIQEACAHLAPLLSDRTAVILIDPLGNAMMRYGPEMSTRDLLKDMERLLRVSRHWRSHENG